MIGFSSSWTMPIKARIDMLATGIRTPIGIKVYGPTWKKSVKLRRRSKRTLAWYRARVAPLPSEWPKATTSTSTCSGMKLPVTV